MIVKGKSTDSRKPLILALAVFVYILAFSFWWTYLLRQKNEENFILQQQLLQFNNGNDLSLTKIESEYRRQKIMIYTEGSVFIGLLLVGLYIVFRTFSKELAIARQQHNFLLSVSHELKSPMAAIKLVLDTLIKRELSADQKFKLLQNASSDVQRLEILVDNILLAARMDGPYFKMSMEKMETSELVRRYAEKFEEQYRGKGLQQLQIITDSNIHIQSNKEALISVLHNLLENAVKYAGPEAAVALKFYKSGNKAVLEVSDNGCGIEDNEKQQVTKKFYRIGNEDTRKTKGTGLGLYIVQRITEDMNGTVEILDNLPRGSIFRVTFPLVV